MNETMRITCPMCGHTYNPNEHISCASCPLQKGCSQLACCPRCGYETVNLERSWLAQAAARLFARGRGSAVRESGAAARTLAKVPPGRSARVIDFSQGIAPQRRAHLLAYGVAPGHTVKVLQHSPVTVVQVDFTELALERDLAGEILIETA